MSVLHLFDLYLPHTMNWAWRLMRSTPETEQWVAAPWFVDNEYHSPEFRYFRRPLQQLLGWQPKGERDFGWFSTNLIRAEKRWPVYRNWLFRQLKKSRPDVLHAHFAPSGCHYVDMAQALGIPLVTSFYGFDYERVPFQKPVYRQWYRRLFNRAAAITCAGPFGLDVLLRQGCPPEKIEVLPMGFRPEEFRFVERKKLAGQLRLVQVATLTEKKGHMDTLHALAIARKSCPKLLLAIAGEKQDQSLVRQMRNYIKTNDLESVVSWQDFLPHTQLAGFLAQYEVFIHPSCYTANRDCEGGPVAILEAQATGLPVVSTTHFDIPSEVLHGQTGLLAPERDPEALARHIERFYHMENNEYQGFAHRARQHVAENFDVLQKAAQLRDLYAKLVSR